VNGTLRKAISRWWLDPAIARLALDDATLDRGARASKRSSPIAPARRIDLADPAQCDFGDYELLEEIGCGGMGVVYRARQRGLDREVALKLLSAGPWASAFLVDTLCSEAQFAARLQHPNIVVVHEMGEHGGLVFYAMQLVRGRSLSQRLDMDGPLPPREAARLLRTLAEAMDYAHRLGVLHLDLKPGNVLIDDDGTPRIADFGLARGLGQAGDESEVSGTPCYMAPEQARPGSTPLSPATDVWALGTVLYETLTGYPPFQGEDAGHTLQLLLEATVRRPSRSGTVPADLEAICLHCLQKDAGLRYAGARALADDLGRFLDGREVSVRPLGLFQRGVRWARRESKVAIMTGLAVAALAIGLAASLWQWRRAVASAAEAREVNRFLNQDVLAAADPYVESGQDPSQITVPDLLSDAEAKLDQGRIEQPSVRAQIGLSIGRAYFGLGLWDRARRRLESARRDAIAAGAHDAPLVLDIEDQLGVTATYDGRYDEAADIYAHLIPARIAQAGVDAPATISARRGHALYLSEIDRFEASAREYEAIYAAALDHAPEQVPDIEWNLSNLYTETNRWEAAERLMRDSLRRSRRELGARHPQYLWEELYLVDLLNMRGRWDDATALATTDRAELIKVLGPNHPKVLTATHYLGQITLERGDAQRALPLLLEALRGRTRAHGEDHKWTQYTMNRVGQAYIALGRPQKGIAMLDHALELATREGRRQQAYVLLILDNLARGEMAVGELEQAEAHLDEALASARSSLPPDNVRRGMLERTLGELRARQDRRDEAIAHYAYAKRVFSGFRPDHPWVLDLEARIAKLQAGTRNKPRATN